MPSSYSKSRGTYAAIAAGTVVAAYAGAKAYESRLEPVINERIDLNNQTVEIDPVEHIRRGVQYADIDIFSYYKTVCPNVQTLGDIFFRGYDNSTNGPCLTNVDLSNKAAPTNWISYGTALERIRYIGSHLWTNAKLIPMQSKVAILSSNRAEYIFVEHACYMYGFTVIGLYTTYDAKTVLSLLERMNTEVLVVDNLDRINSYKNELVRMNGLKEILVMDEIPAGENSKLQSIPSVLKPMQQADVRPLPKVDPESIATLILTSGTTGSMKNSVFLRSCFAFSGEPKLAMLSHNNLLATIKALIERRNRTIGNVNANHRHCSFLPTAHLYERINLIYYFMHGSQVAFCPIPERIFEYYPIIRPTVVSMVPRILNRVYDTIMTEVNKSKIKKFLITQALHNEKPSLFSRVIFRKVRDLFGGEITLMVTGSAPITPEVLHFFRIALGVPVLEAYGQTESTAAGTGTHISDASCGKVGAPGPVVEVKLIDVPDTNYRSNNNQGEVCIRGPTVFKGRYFIHFHRLE